MHSFVEQQVLPAARSVQERSYEALVPLRLASIPPNVLAIVGRSLIDALGLCVAARRRDNVLKLFEACTNPARARRSASPRDQLRRGGPDQLIRRTWRGFR
jgi:hypothetical protein